MNIIDAIDLLIGILSKDDLYVGKIVKVKEIEYLPNGDTIGERMIFSKQKIKTQDIKTTILYKLDNKYYDLITKRIYKVIKTNKNYESNEMSLLPNLGEFYIKEESLIPANYYNLIPEKNNYITKKKILKNFKKLT